MGNGGKSQELVLNMTAAGSEVQLPAALVAALASNDDDNRLYFTAAVWVYVDGELSLGDQMTVFEIDNTISDDDAGTVAMITSVKIGNVANVGTEFFVHVDNGFQGEVYPIAENQWHHVALTATYDGQNQLIVWVDGERVPSAASGMSPSPHLTLSLTLCLTLTAVLYRYTSGGRELSSSYPNPNPGSRHRFARFQRWSHPTRP